MATTFVNKLVYYSVDGAGVLRYRYPVCFFRGQESTGEGGGKQTGIGWPERGVVHLMCQGILYPDFPARH